MTDLAAPRTMIRRPDLSEARIRRRYAAERRFRLYGIVAILLAMGFLGVLLFTIVRQGYTAFTQTVIGLDINFDPAVIDPQGTGR
jgi:phosphate transport system permease protein